MQLTQNRWKKMRQRLQRRMEVQVEQQLSQRLEAPSVLAWPAMGERQTVRVQEFVEGEGRRRARGLTVWLHRWSHQEGRAETAEEGLGGAAAHRSRCVRSGLNSSVPSMRAVREWYRDGRGLWPPSVVGSATCSRCCGAHWRGRNAAVLVRNRWMAHWGVSRGGTRAIDR